EFSMENLQTLNTTVENVGIFLANHANELGYDLTPEEAFQAVLGDVQFIFDNELPERVGQLGLTQGQIISLADSAFYIDTLIPAHELAHVFQNRLGETENKMFVQVTMLDEIMDDEGNVIGIEEKPEDQPIEVPAGIPIVAVHYLI